LEPADVDLLRLFARDGDERAFARLVDRHSGWIYASARRRLGDNHLAEDATQAVFVVLANKMRQLVEIKEGSLSAWLFHVMHFSCARIRRSELRQENLEELAKSTPPKDQNVATFDEPLLLLMEDSISQLPPPEREMVVRRFYQRESFGEIGEAWKISAEAARKRVNRALVEIKKVMVRDGFDAIPDVFLENFRAASAEKSAARKRQIQSIVKGQAAMTQQQTDTSGFQLVSAEFLVKDVEENMAFFEKLGFRRRWLDTPGADGKLPRASMTAGSGKIWIRRAPQSAGTTCGINVFFWVDGGPDDLVAHRKTIAGKGVSVTPIIDEFALPNFTVLTPDGYSVCFFTQYV
jgi:RNA polymerase sigma factor (sigma-70 family)